MEFAAKTVKGLFELYLMTCHNKAVVGSAKSPYSTKMNSYFVVNVLLCGDFSIELNF